MTALILLTAAGLGFTFYGLYRREQHRHEKKQTTNNFREWN